MDAPLRAARGRIAHAQRIADVVFALRRQRLAQPFGRGAQRSRAAGHQCAREQQQVGRGAAQCAGRGQRAEFPGRARRIARVALGQPLGARRVEVLHRVLHAQRHGNALAHQLIPGLAIALRQQLSDQRDAQAAVARRAGRRLRELERGERHHQVRTRGPGEGIGIGPGRARRQRGQVRQAGRVRDELAQRDRGHGRRQRGLVGEQPAQRVVEREVAALHGLCEQQAGEDLADRADLEHRLRLAGRHRLRLADVPRHIALDRVARRAVVPGARDDGAGTVAEDLRGERCGRAVEAGGCRMAGQRQQQRRQREEGGGKMSHGAHLRSARAPRQRAAAVAASPP